MATSVVDKLFIIIRDALAIENLPADFSLTDDEAKAVFAMAKKHAIGQLIDGAVSKMQAGSEASKANAAQITPATKKEIRDSFLSAINADARKSEALKKISTAFEEAEIDFIALKWAYIKKLYPQEWMRTSSDVDILVRSQDFDRACAKLIELGYKKEIEWTNDISFYLNNVIHIELHHRLTGKKSSALSDIFAHSSLAQGSLHRCEIEPEYEYLYHVQHMAKHFKEKGCGIRFFIDLWLLNQKMPYDREKILELLNAEGLADFEKHAVNLSRMWLEGEEHPELTELSDFVTGSAIYGTKEQYVLLKRKKSGKSAYITKRIFLPYKTLARLYPSLKGKKFLTPLYEIKRIFDIIFKKEDALDELKINSSISEEDIKKITKLTDMLGI